MRLCQSPPSQWVCTVGDCELPYNRHFLVLASSYKDVKYTTYVWIKEVIYKLEHQCNILSKYPPPPNYYMFHE